MISSIPDNELIKRIQDDQCSDCLLELQRRHAGIVVDLYSKRYCNVLKSLHFMPQEFNDEVKYLIFNAAKTFDFSKDIKFSYWLGEQTRYFCLNKIKELQKKPKIDGEYEDIINIIDISNKPSAESKLRNEELCNYVFSILKQLDDKRILKIFNLRYFSNRKKKMTWEQIGKKVRMSGQGAINLHNKTAKFLQGKLTSLNPYDKI